MAKEPQCFLHFIVLHWLYHSTIHTLSMGFGKLNEDLSLEFLFYSSVPYETKYIQYFVLCFLTVVMSANLLTFPTANLTTALEEMAAA